MDKLKLIIRQLLGAKVPAAQITDSILAANTGATIINRTGRSAVEAEIKAQMVADNPAPEKAAGAPQRVSKQLNENAQQSKPELDEIAERIYSKPDPRSDDTKRNMELNKRTEAERQDAAKQREFALKRDAETKAWQIKDAKTKTPI